MKTQTQNLLKSTTIIVILGIITFLGLSFKSSDANGQVMTVIPIQSKSIMKGDRDLCLIVDGNIIEKIELPSGFSSKLEDQVTYLLTVNKTLNRLSKEGWRIISTDGSATTLIK